MQTTKTATHTPGPWVVTGYRDTVVNAPNGNTLCLHPGDSDNCPIATVQANARLIAAAPDLLAALQAGVDNEIGMTDWLRMARHAIAKATGGA